MGRSPEKYQEILASRRSTTIGILGPALGAKRRKRGPPKTLRAIPEKYKYTIGHRVGHLVVVSDVPVSAVSPGRGSERTWLVRCDCGIEKRMTTVKLRRAHVGSSCGCLRKEKAVAAANRFGRRKQKWLPKAEFLALHPDYDPTKNSRPKRHFKFIDRCSCGGPWPCEHT